MEIELVPSPGDPVGRWSSHARSLRPAVPAGIELAPGRDSRRARLVARRGRGGGRPGVALEPGGDAATTATPLAAEHPRRDARVVETRDPRQQGRDEERPPGDVGVPGARGLEPCEGRRDRLGPRLQLPEVARAHHDAALDRREAEAGDRDLPRDDRRDHPGGRDALPTSITSAARTSTLSAIGSSSEPKAEV